jgi:hypothetical protein
MARQQAVQNEGRTAVKTGALMLYESEIILIIVESLNGEEHPLRGQMDAADILDECDFPPGVRAALKHAAQEIIQYFARSAHEAGLSPDNHAHLVQEGRA